MHSADYLFVRFKLLSGHLLEKSCLLRWLYVLFVFDYLYLALGLRVDFGILIALLPGLSLL